MQIKRLAVVTIVAVIGSAISTRSAEKKADVNMSSDETTVIVAVYNEARISPKTVRGAEKISAEIFRDAGLQTEWINCDSSHAGGIDPRCGDYTGTRFDLHIIRKSADMSPVVLGLAFVPGAGTGRHADLFYDSVARMKEESGVDAATILGHVAAHELGHLLIGKGHSRTGLMRANWTRTDLLDASRGMLLFSKEESERLRNGLSAARMEQETSPVGEATGSDDWHGGEACCTV